MKLKWRLRNLWNGMWLCNSLLCSIIVGRLMKCDYIWFTCISIGIKMVAITTNRFYYLSKILINIRQINIVNVVRDFDEKYSNFSSIHAIRFCFNSSYVGGKLFQFFTAKQTNENQKSGLICPNKKKKKNPHHA